MARHYDHAEPTAAALLAGAAAARRAARYVPPATRTTGRAALLWAVTFVAAMAGAGVMLARAIGGA